MSRSEGDQNRFSRRQILKTAVGGSLTGLIAGCIGDGGGGSPTTTASSTSNPTPSSTLTPTSQGLCTTEGVAREELDPIDLMPEPPESWSIVDDPSPVDVSSWDTDSAVHAEYEGPNKRNYYVAVGKFDTHAEASDETPPGALDIYYEDGYRYGVTGIFGVEARGDKGERARALLLAVPCVDEKAEITPQEEG